MNLVEWSESSVDYGRKLMNSAVEGARTAEDEFLELQEEALTPYLSESARQALGPAVMGACLGIVGSCMSPRRSAAKTLALGLLGGVIGFGVGMIWDTRQFTARIASGAWKSISKTRDEHWFEKNPIDYA